MKNQYDMRMYTRLCLIYLLSLTDLICTLSLCERFGGADTVESNPLGRVLLAFPGAAEVYKAVIVALSLAVLWRCRHNPLTVSAACSVLAVFIILTVYHGLLTFI